MLNLLNTAGKHHHHGRGGGSSWLCEACDRAPAAFLCKADAASLCAACDADVHSANPLARRHHRVPILPGGALYGCSPAAEADDAEEIFDEDEAASWLLLNPVKNGGDNNQSEAAVDEYLDLDGYNTCCQNNNGQFKDDDEFNDYNYQQQRCNGGDSVVPIQLGLEYDSSTAGYSYSVSMSHAVSLSQLDVGVVPESTTSENSISHTKGPSTIDLFSGPLVQMPVQLTGMDREARVLRYREKKKMRKFEKTIRYASRKAYAETRPRIKGRFAKRRDAVEVEVDQMFSASVLAETGYSIVPSF